MFDVKQMTEMAEKFAELQKNYGVKPEEFANALAKMVPSAPAMPKVKFNKTGFEIRAEMLELASSQMWQDYHAKLGAYETSVSKEDDEVVTKVEFPEAPTTEAILEAAEKFYNFVNTK